MCLWTIALCGMCDVCEFDVQMGGLDMKFDMSNGSSVQIVQTQQRLHVKFIYYNAEVYCPASTVDTMLYKAR